MVTVGRGLLLCPVSRDVVSDVRPGTRELVGSAGAQLAASTIGRVCVRHGSGQALDHSGCGATFNTKDSLSIWAHCGGRRRDVVVLRLWCPAIYITRSW